MFSLSEFYQYCNNNAIDIIPYDGAPSQGTTIRDGNWYAIFLDFAKIRSTRCLRGTCYHEMGHAATGALHKVDSPFETVERSEYRAKRWSAEMYLTAEDFMDAFSCGYTELWQLAEYFDLPENDVFWAYCYWTESKGIDFNKT